MFNGLIGIKAMNGYDRAAKYVYVRPIRPTRPVRPVK